MLTYSCYTSYTDMVSILCEPLVPLRRKWFNVLQDIFWTLIPKIIIILAENQSIARFKGGLDVIITLFRHKQCIRARAL